MKYLLIATLVFWSLFYWAYKASNNGGDDFGAAFPALVLGALSIALTIIYVALVFWYHSFF